jgi:MerR family regulatory protein
MTAGALAKQAGVKIDTIRYYERRGLLPKPPRTNSGYRTFTPASVCAVISPIPSALQAARSRRLNARFENGSPEYPANTNCDAAKAIPPRSHDPAAFRILLDGLPVEERCTQASGNGHILEDARDDFLPHPLAI